MRNYITALFVFASWTVSAEGMVTSDAILSIINDPTNDELVCQRATQMSKGELNKANCIEKLPSAKETCAEATNNHIGMYINTPEQAALVARTITFCQVWSLLGYETAVTDAGVHYIKKPGGILP